MNCLQLPDIKKTASFSPEICLGIHSNFFTVYILQVHQKHKSGVFYNRTWVFRFRSSKGSSTVLKVYLVCSSPSRFENCPSQTKSRQVILLLSCRARICKRFRSPGIDSVESILPAYVAWRAGTSNRVVALARRAGNRFLVSLKGLHIRAQISLCVVKVIFLKCCFLFLGVSAEEVAGCCWYAHFKGYYTCL